MSGVYGDFLGSFPELFQPITFYSMDKEINGSLNNDNVVCKLPVILIDEDTSGLFRQLISGTGSHDVLNLKEDVFIYALTPNKLTVGLYFKHPQTGFTMKLTNPLDRALQGGTIIYKAESLTGITDQNNKTLNIAGGLF